jgi:hypothetical protein
MGRPPVRHDRAKAACNLLAKMLEGGLRPISKFLCAAEIGLHDGKRLAGLVKPREFSRMGEASACGDVIVPKRRFASSVRR